jgi:hypothetical protein
VLQIYAYQSMQCVFKMCICYRIPKSLFTEDEVSSPAPGVYSTDPAAHMQAEDKVVYIHVACRYADEGRGGGGQVWFGIFLFKRDMHGLLLATAPPPPTPPPTA